MTQAQSSRNPNKLIPLVMTDDLDAIRAFYRERIGAHFTFDLDNYVQVRFTEDESGPELAYMSAPQGASIFGGQGIIISVPTPDADAEHERIAGRGAQILETPADRPWGWRSFHVPDPTGVVLDFFHVLPQAAAADAAS
jgi:lactoylglutathione lyase